MLFNDMDIYNKLVYCGEKYKTKYNQKEKNSNSKQNELTFQLKPRLHEQV